MPKHLLSVAAFALLSVFTVISTPCHAQEEGVQNAPETPAAVVGEPSVNANTDATQQASPEGQSADLKSEVEDVPSVEEKVEPEYVPPSEE